MQRRGDSLGLHGRRKNLKASTYLQRLLRKGRSKENTLCLWLDSLLFTAKLDRVARSLMVSLHFGKNQRFLLQEELHYVELL